MSTITMKLKLTFCIVLLFGTTIVGQSLLATRYPTGLNYTTNGVAARYGGAGIGLPEGNMCMSLNPGNLGNVSQSVYSITLQSDFTKVKLEDDGEVTIANFTPTQLNFAFPLGKLGTVGVAYQNNAGNTFEYLDSTQYLIHNGSDSLLVYRAKGLENTTSAFEIGYGYSIREWLNIGATYQRWNFINTTTNILVNDDSLTNNTPIDVTSSMEELEVRQKTSVLRLGLSGTVKQFSYGISGSFPFFNEAPYQYAVKEINDKGDISEEHFEDIYKFNGQLHFPPRGGAGISWNFDDKVTLAYDYSMTFWKYYWHDVHSAFLEDPSIYQSTVRTSLGAVYTPAANRLAPKYWETIQYGGGIRFETLPLEGDKEIALTLSAGFPLGTMGYIDFAIEGGMRRSESFKEAEENYIKLIFSTGGGRQWKKTGTAVY